MTDYTELKEELAAVSDGVCYEVTLLSNAAALIYDRMEDLNWAGFYLMRDGKLILGPFIGKPACTAIEVGKGVCGTAVIKNAVERVEDVHRFDGHIACDSASNSEIVLPIRVHGTVYGVLDIDSPLFSRFSEMDETGLLSLVEVLEECLEAIL